MNELLSWLGLETGHNALEAGNHFLEIGQSMSFGVASVRWGLTLLHFLWQGAVIGLLALVVARLLRNHSASVRYWLNAVALIACPICVAWTFTAVEVPETWRASSDPHKQESRDTIAVPIETSNSDNLVDVPYPKHDPPQTIPSTIAAPIPLDAAAETPATAPVAIEIKTSTTSGWMPVVARWIAILYTVGVVCFLVRLAIALWGGHRLRAISTPVSDSALLELIRTQAHRIGLKLVPVVAYCERVAVPTVIGVLRPMILLPATLTTGLTSEELSAILSHELAHIRRYDLWMNLLQRIIESLMFFHPVVWFLSHRLSAEREICCDDLVVSSGHQPMDYAGALLRMAELCTAAKQWAPVTVAATGVDVSLLETRVLRLLEKPVRTRLRLTRVGLFGLTTGFIALISSLSTSQVNSMSDQVQENIAAENQTQAQNGAPGESPQAENREAAAGIEKEPRKIRIVVTNEMGEPIPDARVFSNCVRLADAKPVIVNTELQTDDDGISEIEIDRVIRSLRVWISTPARVSLYVHWEEGETGDIPSQYAAILQTGTELGGRILDPDGKPVAGARVELTLYKGGIKKDSNRNSELNSWLASGDNCAVTDADGRWAIRNAPAGDNLELRLAAMHPDFLFEQATAPLAKFGLTLDELRNKTGVVTLKRGIPIHGTVNDPNGMPVSKAIVIRGDQPYWESGSQEVLTDEKGHFSIPPQKAGPLRLTVVAKGWMPHTEILDVQTGISALDFRLKNGKKLHLRIVDPAGKPCPGAYVEIQSWRGAESLYNEEHSNVLDTQIPRRANDEGEYVWDWAPDDPVSISIAHRKSDNLVVSKTMDLTPSDTLQIITLEHLLRVSGTVINALTKQPISNYTVQTVTYTSESPNARGIIQSSTFRKVAGAEFEAVSEIYRDIVQNAFQFESPGYKVYRTKRFGIHEPEQSLVVELEPTEIQGGRIQNTDGQPVSAAVVRMARPEDSLIVHDAEDFLKSRDPALDVDINGRFRHATQTSRFVIVAATAEGYAEKYCLPGEPTGDLTLLPWARVEGTLYQEGIPVPDASIMLKPIRELGRSNPHLQDNFQTRTDVNGRFVLAKVPPVPCLISTWLSSWEDFPVTSNQSIPLDLKPGETISVKIGGDGLQVDGKVQLTGDIADKIDLRYGIHRLVRIDGGRIAVPEHASDSGDFYAGEQRAYEEKLAGNSADIRGMEQHMVKLSPDGTMLINGVRPGAYRLLFKVYEPPSGCLVDPVGYGFLEFHTNDYQVVNNRINLGTINISLKPVPKVGDELAAFSWKDADGKATQLKDLRGQFVMLDFWATWCAPCLQSMPRLQQLHEQNLANKELTIVSLNIDDQPETGIAYVREQKLTWNHGFLGNLSTTSSGAVLGVTSVPLFILVDPQGKVAARSTSLDEIMKSHPRIFASAVPEEQANPSPEIGDTNAPILAPHCLLEIENLKPRPLVEAIAAFNVTSQESPTGVLQPPITEPETRDAIAKFVAELHVPQAVRAQLNEILKSGSLPSNVYFRRFTRFDDGKEMHGVWSVRLVVETNGPVYSVPVRSRFLYSRPYSQMERQQNADGLTLINRVASYYEEPPVVVQPSDLPAASVETLIRKTQDAIKAEDDAALGSLFESTGASETQREFAISELKAISKATVRSVKVSPLKLKGKLRTWSAWQYYKPNVPVVAFLEIEYEDTDAATRRADAQPLAEERKVLSLELGLAGDELRLVNYVSDGERTPPESLNPGPSITGHLEPLADGTHLVTDIITNPGTLLSAHLANEEIRQRDFRNASEQEEDSPAIEQPNASTKTPPEKAGTPNAPAPETKTSADQTPPAAEKAANRYRILSADGEPISNAVVRLIHQKETFRELISHDLIHETKTDAEGSFEYPAGLQVANEMDNGGFSATWITLPARDGQPEQSWLLGSSAGVRFPYFEAIAAMMRSPNSVSLISAASAGRDAKSSELPNVFRLPKFETTIRVVNADGSPAAGVQVTPSQIAWARSEGGSKNIFVPDIVRDSLSRTTDADGRVTFATIDRMEFAEIEFRSEQHGLQRTFTNMNTIGPELEHDVVLFPAGKVTGTIRASTAEQKEFLRTNKLLLQTQVINLGLPAPKGFRIAMEGIAEVTPDEHGRFEIPAMLAGQMFLLDRLPDNSLHRITFKPRQITKSSESSLIEGQVISAVKIQGIARERDSKEGVAGIPISIRHGGRQAGLSRELTAYPRTDADGRFEAHVFPGRAGYSSLITPEGYVQAWNWDLDYDAKQEWLYGQRIIVPSDTSDFELPPLEFIRAKEIRGKLVDADRNPVARTGIYARARANQNGNDFATTDQNGEFVLKGFAEGYFPEAVQVGEQFKLRSVQIISRDPLILQDSQPAAK